MKIMDDKSIRSALVTTPQPAAGWDEAIERVQSAYEELCVRFSGAHSDRAMDSVLLRLYVALKSLRREAPAPAVDLTNHHNALKCPYCNPEGLTFARPDTAEARLREALANACDRLQRFLDTFGDIGDCVTQADIDDWIALTTKSGLSIDALVKDTLARQHAELEQKDRKIDSLTAMVSDYEEVLADKRRLAREIDVALHGEEGAAKQASLCDLVEPARQMRERTLRAEQQRDEAYERAAKAARQIAINAERRAANHTPQSQAEEAALNKAQGAFDAEAAIRRLASGPEGGSEGEK